MSGEAVSATKATMGTERAGGATQGADTGDGRIKETQSQPGSSSEAVSADK